MLQLLSIGVARYLQWHVFTSESNSSLRIIRDERKEQKENRPKFQIQSKRSRKSNKKERNIFLPYSQFQSILQSKLFKAPELF